MTKKISLAFFPKCHKCGKELDFWDLQNNFCFRLEFGYGSKYDGEKLIMCLCDGCVESIVDGCVIHPIELSK